MHVGVLFLGPCLQVEWMYVQHDTVLTVSALFPTPIGHDTFGRIVSMAEPLSRLDAGARPSGRRQQLYRIRTPHVTGLVAEDAPSWSLQQHVPVLDERRSFLHGEHRCR